MDKALLEEDYYNDKLQEEILSLIFQNITGIKSMLDCRLICRSWKSAFDNSNIMRELTFKVNDWRSLNKSTILDKVKSITFNVPFFVTKQESKYEWIEFCDSVGSTLEKIED